MIIMFLFDFCSGIFLCEVHDSTLLFMPYCGVTNWTLHPYLVQLHVLGYNLLMKQLSLLFSHQFVRQCLLDSFFFLVNHVSFHRNKVTFLMVS